MPTESIKICPQIPQVLLVICQRILYCNIAKGPRIPCFGCVSQVNCPKETMMDEGLYFHLVSVYIVMFINVTWRSPNGSNTAVDSQRPKMDGRPPKAITLMNILIGIVVEVIGTVATAERLAIRFFERRWTSINIRGARWIKNIIGQGFWGLHGLRHISRKGQTVQRLFAELIISCRPDYIFHIT